MKIKKTIAIIVLICLLIIDGMIIKLLVFPKPHSISGAHLIYAKDRQAFNGQFNQFSQEQNGSNIKSFFDIMIKNIKMNDKQLEKAYGSLFYSDDNDWLFPDLIIETNKGQGGYVVSTDKNRNLDAFKNLEKIIDSNNSYYVTVCYNPWSSIIELIIIEYGKGDLINPDIDNSFYNEKGEPNTSIFGGTAFDKKHKEPSAMNVISK